jgi:hypothetical protein
LPLVLSVVQSQSTGTVVAAVEMQIKTEQITYQIVTQMTENE